ncbi:MAG: ion channel [Geitlerinemataceae cyanobacterium]
MASSPSALQLVPSEPTAPQFSVSVRAASLFISATIVLSVVTFVAATLPLDPAWLARLRLLDCGIAIVFAVEYVVRVWAAEHKAAFLLNWMSALDAIVIFDLLAGLVGLPFVPGLRGLRLLRLLRFFDIDLALLHLDSRDRIICARILFTLAAIVTIFAGPIYEVEHRANPENFATVLDAIYFSIVTMTTVGFGDMTPVSSAGRLLTVLMILTGVALIPWQIGQLIEQLVKSARRVSVVCPGCGHDRHDREAQFCARCGTQLDTCAIETETHH